MRVVRHFGFVDLSGFTALADTRGDEVAVSVVASFRALLREVCSRRGVRIAKWLGDGAMLVTVEPTPLLAATLELERAVAVTDLPVPVRAGASSGEVILLEGDDYLGQPINLAARLCDLATGGEVLAGPAIAGHLPRWGAVESSEELTVRGFARPVQVSRLGLAPLSPPVTDDPVCGIPLTAEVAEDRVRDQLGREVLFCSDSCRDTWERRPRPPVEGQGSLRSPLIGT